MSPTLRLPRRNPKSRAFYLRRPPRSSDSAGRFLCDQKLPAGSHSDFRVAAGQAFSGLFPVVINLPADYALMESRREIMPACFASSLNVRRHCRHAHSERRACIFPSSDLEPPTRAFAWIAEMRCIFTKPHFEAVSGILIRRRNSPDTAKRKFS